MMIFMLLFWVVIIALGAMLFSQFSHKVDVYKDKSSALEILEERYAKGEIKSKEFKEKKKVLENES